MKKFLKLTSDYHDQIIAGAAVAIIGVFLIISRQYFFWPPEWSSVLNDMRIDIVVFLAGIGLVISAYLRNQVKWLSYTSFILSGAVMLALGVTQFFHIIYAGQFRMTHTIIGDLVVFVLILYSAYDS